jgi:hypothetical protein
MFAVKSLEHGILFRGAFASGSFYVDKTTSTVLGDAVSDAAAWYDQADWMGITATPHATLLIRSLFGESGLDLSHVLIDYAVPLKDGTNRPLMAVNWPMAFFVRGVRPKRCANGEQPKVVCLSLLVEHGVPKGTEFKYFNTVKFFDDCAKRWGNEHKARHQEKAKT